MPISINLDQGQWIWLYIVEYERDGCNSADIYLSVKDLFTNRWTLSVELQPQQLHLRNQYYIYRLRKSSEDDIILKNILFLQDYKYLCV